MLSGMTGSPNCAALQPSARPAHPQHLRRHSRPQGYARWSLLGARRTKKRRGRRGVNGGWGGLLGR
eukprot:SAG11_NODE_27235_length_335_cov_0.656780_1_plen_65_part_10